MPPGSSPRYKSRPGPAREVTETQGRASVPRCLPGALQHGPRPVQMKTMHAQGGQMAAAVASVANVVSTPPRHSQRPHRQDRQYPAAPGLVSAPTAPSVPHRARVSERAIRVSTPGGPAARLPRAQLVPQLGPTAGRVTYDTTERTNGLGQDDSSEQARWQR